MLGQNVTVRAVSDYVALDYSTTHRLLATLSNCGYVERNPSTRRFSTGRQLHRLDQVRSNGFLIRLAQPILRALSERSDETATLSRRQGTMMVLLSIEQRTNALNLRTRPGDLYPIHCTASGKVVLSAMAPKEQERLLARLDLEPLTDFTIGEMPILLSELDEIRRQGFSVNVEEHVERREAIAAPVVDESGNTIAAACLTVPSERIPRGRSIDSFARLVLEAAVEMSTKYAAATRSP